MKKLLILALASAFSVVATATTTSEWFRGASNGSQLTFSNATWSVVIDEDVSSDFKNVSYDSNNIVLDLDSGETLVLTPDANTAPDTNTVTVVNISDAVFTPCAFDSIDADLTNGVQTALTVAYKNGETNYYAHSNGEWVQLAGVPSSEPVSVVIKMNYYESSSVTATFKIGNGDEQTKPVGTTSRSVGSVSLAGNGKVKSLATGVELGYASYGGRKYPSVADAIAARGNNVGNDITLHKHSDSYGADNVIAITNDQQTVLAFPRTTTSGQDGTESHPYEIADAGGLVALTNAVAQVEGARSKHYKQMADIDMTSAGAFAGIGTYDANPTNGIPFTGTYDGQGHKISNVTMTARNYGGIFNQVNGGTIKNLTVENMSFPADATGEYGFGIVGNVGGDDALLQNLVAAGSFGSAGKPGTHNMAGIVVRACGGGTNGALVQNCTNNAAIYGNYTKLAGICAITQHKIDGAAITFDGCANKGTLTSSYAINSGDKAATGLAGIVGYISEPTVLVGCSNTGSLVNTGAANTDVNGQLVGYAYNQTLTDNGGNTASAGAKMIGKYGNSTVTGFKYATVDNDVATTVTGALAKDTTYLLEGNVVASATPVFTFNAPGTIAFKTSLGYTFEGTVAVADGLVADRSDDSGVVTYTAYNVASVAEVAVEEVSTDLGIVSKDDLKATLAGWIADGVVSATALTGDAAAAITAPRDTGNKLTLLQCYVLNLNATNANATVKAELPASGPRTDGTGNILIKVPTPRSDTGYTVKYQIKSWSGSAWTDEGGLVDYDKIKIPVGTGRYRVDAVLQK